jgi:uncharacterized protein (TIGR02266 family)
VFALKLGSTNRSARKVDPKAPLDPSAMTHEEALLEQLEASVSARMLALHEREVGAALAIEEHRQELVTLGQTIAGLIAHEALSQLPAFMAPATEPTAERIRALEVRQAALEARRVALKAEEQDLAERERVLLLAEEGAQAGKVAIERIRAKLAAIAPATPRAAAGPPPSPSSEIERVLEDQLMEVSSDDIVSYQPDSGVISGVVPAERRRAKRVQMNAEVTLHSDSNFYNGFSADISEGGIFVATASLEDPGTEVDLAFTLGEHVRIEAKGVVRWVREFDEQNPDAFPGMGIEFTELDPASLEAVRAFAREREPIFWAS